MVSELLADARVCTASVLAVMEQGVAILLCLGGEKKQNVLSFAVRHVAIVRVWLWQSGLA